MPDDNVLPLLDRRAPLIERIRNGRKSDAGQEMGKLLGDIVESDDQEAIEATLVQFSNNFDQALAQRLGIEQGEINPDLSGTLQEFMLNLEESDVILQQGSMMTQPDEETEQQTENQQDEEESEEQEVEPEDLADDPFDEADEEGTEEEGDSEDEEFQI